MSLNITGAAVNLSDYGLAFYDDPSRSVNVLVQLNTIGWYEGMFTALVIYIVAVLCHELGHYWVLKKHAPDTHVRLYMKGWLPCIETGEQKDYDPLNPEQKNTVYIMGILTGFLPIIMGGMIAPLYFVLIGPYIVGLSSDFKMIRRNWGQ